jgi:uncharacterized small protein (DUF1192 family)
MALTGSSPYARTMSNREKIEALRREVSVDYAFGVAGLLLLADAVDELAARVAVLEEEVGRHQDQPDRPASDPEIVAALEDLGRNIEKLAKSVKKIRRP